MIIFTARGIKYLLKTGREMYSLVILFRRRDNMAKTASLQESSAIDIAPGAFKEREEITARKRRLNYLPQQATKA